MSASRQLRRRRGVALGISIVLPFVLVVGLGHRGVHMARNLLVPGAGLFDERLLVGLALVVLAIAATIGWLRWGIDWAVAAVVILAMGLSAALTSPAAHLSASLEPSRAAHEFPIVLLVVAALSWMRGVAGRTPLFRRVAVRRSTVRRGLDDIARLSPVDRCRTVSILALADDPALSNAAAAIDRSDVQSRARRIGLVARGRRGGDPFRVDHSHARTAMALSGRLDGDALERFVGDAANGALGVPCSEPGWVRPLDGTLCAIALDALGGDGVDASAPWAAALGAEFGLRRGHRPAWWWTPLGISAGSMPWWEHAATTGLARAMGWIGDDDWSALRAPALGASARGVEHPADERVIAAARVWLVYVDDPDATRLLARPTIRHDPMAIALDRLAARLAADAGALRRERNLTP